ncbi:YcbK family protein [Sedimenticola sp.]|uniref:YcbK family protein n=1 Tax=Sedimenticola sp. TaxID=1940285 RepID=UPI003D119654
MQLKTDNKEHRTPTLSRRGFLRGCAAAAATFVLPDAFASINKHPERRLTLHHLHTGERSRITYWADGSYDRQGLKEINHLLRDHRTGDQHTMDPHLFDLLYSIQDRIGCRGEFQIISGYRSPKTNRMLRKNSSGVAKHSLHMDGKALDIRLAGCDLKHLHRVAKSLKAGGVGLYAQSNFVHVDTGRVRYW